MDHSYEEIRHVMVDILAGRETTQYAPTQFAHLKLGVAEVFERREASPENGSRESRASTLSRQDCELVREVFWDLFRQGVITIGLNDADDMFPFFCVSSYGKRILEGADPYFFYDSATYEKVIGDEIPNVDATTLVYLKEAMQAFRSGCILSCSVMLGVASEHTFRLLIEAIDANPTHSHTFKAVSKERGILNKANRFKEILDKQKSSLPSDVLEDLDTRFAGVLSIVREFRNESGHPTGKIISREQAYVLMQLFISYCKKMYQLRDHYS